MKGCTNYTDEATNWARPTKRPPLLRLALIGVLVVVVAVGVVVFWPDEAGEGFAVASVGEQAEGAAQMAGSSEQTGQAGQVAATSDTGEQAADQAADQAAEQTGAGEPLFVYLTGAVVTPGVFELEQGARLNDAIEQAGGLAEGAAVNYVNLAAPLVDGQHVHIPSGTEIESGEAARIAAGGASATTAATASTGTGAGAATETAGEQKVNINTANNTELETLPGVGVATAQRIIDYREKNGPFTSIEGLKDVSGIGEKKYAELADKVCI
jgi:competence protein ComEA